MEHREIVAAVTVVALLAAIVGGSLLINRPAQANADDVVAQSATTPGNNAFSPSVAAPETSPSTVPSPPPSQPTPTGVSGTSPGLYGGTRNNATCDRQKLIDYLKANPDKAAAWAAVENIRVDEIPAYILSLTPVVLRYDMWVTNHGFYNGVATPYQAMLQAGTAVLVDHYGTPRARCYCGNPLLPPVHITHPHYTGTYWRGFSSTTIIWQTPTERAWAAKWVLMGRNPGMTAVRLHRPPPRARRHRRAGRTATQGVETTRSSGARATRPL
jgi:hypothetical protein